MLRLISSTSAAGRRRWSPGALADALLSFAARVTDWFAATIYRPDVAARDLGGYRLGALIARGGMGEVYEARHLLLGRPAAIKLVRPDLVAGDPRRRERYGARFRQEAEAVSRLHSPHTVRLYDFGVAANGTMYQVMELLDGLDLGSMVREFGSVPADRALHLLRQACASIAEVHASGMIHRDIKPANVMVCGTGDRADLVKVLDFGLARAEEREDPTAAPGPGAERWSGSPGFVAPEVVLGRRASRRSDVYALGCVAYWLLTGQHLFPGHSPRDVVAQHVTRSPVPPSRRAGVHVPAELEALVLRCLEKDPAARPADAGELLALLDQCESSRTWTDERAREWWAAAAERRGRCAGGAL